MSKSEKLAEKFGANLAQTVNRRTDASGQPVPAPGSYSAGMQTVSVRTDSSGQPLPVAVSPGKYEGAIKSRAFAELPVELVDRDESQPREEFDPDDLRRLAESIARFGQLAPIRVRHDEARGRWVVLVGERRLRACKLAGLDRVRVEFVERAMSQADILAEQTVENMVRAPLSPVEQARAYHRLMELHNWTAKELSETIGVEATAVYRSLALLRLPEDVADRVDSGEIKATAAYEIAKLQIADDQRAVADAVVAGELDHKATVAAVTRRRAGGDKAKGATKARPKRPTERTIKTSSGIKIVATSRKGFDAAALLAMLEEAAAKVRAEIESGDDQAAA